MTLPNKAIISLWKWANFELIKKKMSAAETIWLALIETNLVVVSHSVEKKLIISSVCVCVSTECAVNWNR